MGEGTLEKIIRVLIGVLLCVGLAFVGLSNLQRAGDTVIHRMDEKALKLKAEALKNDCERAKSNYQKTPSEINKNAAKSVCEKF